jgi:hypothetical protein
MTGNGSPLDLSDRIRSLMDAYTASDEGAGEDPAVLLTRLADRAGHTCYHATLLHWVAIKLHLAHWLHLHLHHRRAVVCWWHQYSRQPLTSPSKLASVAMPTASSQRAKRRS